MRPPVVGGVGGGVGTTTLAVALHGRDGGVTEVADVLVCRATVDSLRRAAAVLERIGPGPQPVLAVTLDGARLPRGPVRTRLRALEPEASAVVLLPHVRTWRTIDEPSTQAATLLVEPIERVPWPLRAYATAVHDVAAAVVGSGRLPTGSPLPDIAEATGGRRLQRSDLAETPGGRELARPGSAAAPGHRLPAIGESPRRTAREVPRVAGASRPAVAPSSDAVPHVVRTARPIAAPHDKEPQRGVRILTRAAPVPVRPVLPVHRGAGVATTPDPGEQAG